MPTEAIEPGVGWEMGHTGSPSRERSAPATATTGRMSDLDPMSVFGIGGLGIDGTTVRAEQQLSPRFADHRGRIDLPAFGVLFDHLGGIPFHEAGGGAALSMQARLNLSALGDVASTDRLLATADLAMHDAATGLTQVEIRRGADVRCFGTARNMRVGRAAAVLPQRSDLVAPAVADPADAEIAVPALPTDVAGATIVAEIAAGDRPSGPLAELLGARIEHLTDSGGLRLIVDTDGWMGNFFGTMHGGVIATIIGQAVSFAGQRHTPTGGDYRVADMSLGFFRSPPVDGVPITVDVEPVKIGRRITSFSARMVGPDGTLLADGLADVHGR